MFQYCIYRSLKEKKKEVKMDITAFDSYKRHNGYELSKVFNIHEDLAKKLDIYSLGDIKDAIFSKIRRRLFGKKKTHFVEKQYNFDSTVFNLDNKYLDGYWQTEKYFKDIETNIRKEFTFKNKLDRRNQNLINKIKQGDSISIHVRRGDYINNFETANLYSGICTLNYYKKAIDIMKKEICNPIFYIFSDDIEWVKSKLELEDAIYVNWNKGHKSYIDMQLMSKCKYNIIANSTFSWWGAWLNNYHNKIVIAPKKWFSDNNINSQDIIPDGWRRVGNV